MYIAPYLYTTQRFMSCVGNITPTTVTFPKEISWYPFLGQVDLRLRESMKCKGNNHNFLTFFLHYSPLDLEKEASLSTTTLLIISSRSCDRVYNCTQDGLLDLIWKLPIMFHFITFSVDETRFLYQFTCKLCRVVYFCQ